jgi:hypothetical protein
MHLTDTSSERYQTAGDRAHLALYAGARRKTARDSSPPMNWRAGIIAAGLRPSTLPVKNAASVHLMPSRERCNRRTSVSRSPRVPSVGTRRQSSWKSASAEGRPRRRRALKLASGRPSISVNRAPALASLADLRQSLTGSPHPRVIQRTRRKPVPSARHEGSVPVRATVHAINAAPSPPRRMRPSGRSAG